VYLYWIQVLDKEHNHRKGPRVQAQPTSHTKQIERQRAGCVSKDTPGRIRDEKGRSKSSLGQTRSTRREVGREKPRRSKTALGEPEGGRKSRGETEMRAVGKPRELRLEPQSAFQKLAAMGRELGTRDLPG